MSSLGTKVFINLRKLIFPFKQIIPHVTRDGEILDIGCGHGTLAGILSNDSPNRKILAIDPSRIKISEAKKLYPDKNIKFKVSTIEKLPFKKYDNIIIVDVLYLMPYKHKLNLLSQAQKRLKEDGVILLKEIIKEKGLMYYLILIEEFLMLRVLRLTYSNSKQSEILTKKEHIELLKKAGLKVTKVKKIKALLPYPHTLFIASHVQNNKA